MAILVDVYFLFQAMSSILDEDEQEGADEPRKGVPFHGGVSPCAREAGEALRRDEHAGCGVDEDMGMGEGGGGGGGGGGEAKRGAVSNVVEDEGGGRQGREGCGESGRVAGADG